LAVYTRYSKKRKSFTVKLNDPKYVLEAKVKLKKGRTLSKARIAIVKGFLTEMLQEMTTGVSLVQEGKKKIFREYCKLRSDALNYIETLDELDFYEKKKPVPSTIIA